jgi:hypothetical protein
MNLTSEERRALIILAQREKSYIQYWWSPIVVGGLSYMCHICNKNIRPMTGISVIKHGLSHLKNSKLMAFI